MFHVITYNQLLLKDGASYLRIRGSYNVIGRKTHNRRQHKTGMKTLKNLL